MRFRTAFTSISRRFVLFAQWGAVVAGDQHTAGESLDAAVALWPQGDVTLGDDLWFLHRLDVEHAITEGGKAAAAVREDFAEQQVVGFVIVTQTCDIARAARDRPFVDVCPLVEVDETCLGDVRRGRRPRYAYLPATAQRRLVVDLDRVMTVEKPVVARWQRVVGCRTVAERREFAKALKRKWTRVAFPDDFVSFARKLHKRIAEKHDGMTDEGRGLRALREIRVQARPARDAPVVELSFWFSRNREDETFEGRRWEDLLRRWEELVPASGRYGTVRCGVQRQGGVAVVRRADGALLLRCRAGGGFAFRG